MYSPIIGVGNEVRSVVAAMRSINHGASAVIIDK